jgi:hypothetical protein
VRIVFWNMPHHGDLNGLAKGVLDCLQRAGIIENDRFVVDAAVSKRWDDGAVERTWGSSRSIRPPGALPPAGIERGAATARLASAAADREIRICGIALVRVFTIRDGSHDQCPVLAVDFVDDAVRAHAEAKARPSLQRFHVEPAAERVAFEVVERGEDAGRVRNTSEVLPSRSRYFEVPRRRRQDARVARLAMYASSVTLSAGSKGSANVASSASESGSSSMGSEVCHASNCSRSARSSGVSSIP